MFVKKIPERTKKKKKESLLIHYGVSGLNGSLTFMGHTPEYCKRSFSGVTGCKMEDVQLVENSIVFKFNVEIAWNNACQSIYLQYFSFSL